MLPQLERLLDFNTYDHFSPFASTYMRGRGKGIFAFGAYVTGLWSCLYVWRNLEHHEFYPYALYTPLRSENFCVRLKVKRGMF